MSAIVGILSTDRSPLPTELAKRMTASGAHRGSEAMTVKLIGNVALGATLLRITDEDYTDDQPIGLNMEGLWIVFDGRLDNRDELLDIFSVAPKYRGISDCRLALLAYRRWKRQCAEKLIGTFALIVWDAQAQHLFCAIDHLGARPLFYVQQAHHVAVASTIRQLLEDKDTSYEIDDKYMLATLCFPSAAPLWSRYTPYRGICRLLPAHTLTIYSNGQCEVKRYWHPEKLPILDSQSPTDLAEQVRNTFLKIVHAQLRSCTGVMPTFSGGLDSSSITCAAAMFRDVQSLPCRDLRPISLTFKPGSESDESEFRRDAVEQYRLSVVEVPGDRQWHLRELLDSAPFPDEPFGSYIAWREVKAYADAAHDNSCNVVLFGIGGDEFMAGCDLFLADHLLRGQFRKLAFYMKERAHLANMNYASVMLKLVILPLIPARFWRTYALNRQQRRWDPLAEWYRPVVPPWLAPEMCINHGVLEEVWFEFPERWTGQPSRIQQLGQMRQNMSLSWYDNYAFMPLGCEARAPFFDRRFIELSLMIPEAWKSHVGSEGYKITKLILREAMRDILPEKIRTRTNKASFNTQFALGLRNEWSAIIGDGCFEVASRNYVAKDRLEKFLHLWRLGSWDYLGQITNLLTVELWLRQLKLQNFNLEPDAVRLVRVV